MNIVATTDKFIAGLNQSQTALGRFVGKISTVQNALIGLGVAGFAAVVKGAIDAGGALFDLSQKLNISTEALGALHFAASQLGSSGERVDVALQFMTKTLGQAALGSDKAIGSFNQLGLNFNELLKLPVEQQFLAIVDALHKIPDRAIQAAAGTAIFGKGMKDLTAMVAAGTGEIIKFSDEAAAAGILVGSETAEKMDEASDAISKLINMWGSLKIALVGDYAEEITTAVDMIGGAILGLRVAFITMQVGVVFAMEIVARSIVGVLDLMNLLLPKFAEINTQKGQSFVETLASKRAELSNRAIDLVQGTDKGPLKIPDSKAVEKNTAATNDKMDELIEATKAKGPQLQVAGVR